MKARTLYNISNLISVLAMSLYVLNLVLFKQRIMPHNYIYFFTGLMILSIWIRTKAKQKDDTQNPIYEILICRILNMAGFLAFGVGLFALIQHWPFWWLILVLGSVLQSIAFALTFYLKPIEKESGLLDDVDFEE